VNSVFFENFSGFSSGRIFTSADIVLFSGSISSLSHQAVNKQAEWYTAKERLEFEGLKSVKRYGEKLSGKFCAKMALAFFLQQKTGFVTDFRDFSIVSKDHPVMLIAENMDLTGSLPPCFCSISHSGDIAVAAVSGGSVGVDIEVLRKLHSNMTDSIISPLEKKAVQFFFADNFNLPEELLPVAVFTCKEAVLKAMGCGIAGGLLQVELGGGAEKEGLKAVYKEKSFCIRCLLSGDMFLSLASPATFDGVCQNQHYTG
jgi:phosphopantetheinyl transferase